MDFRLGPTEEKWRQEVRQWIRENLPGSWEETPAPGDRWEASREFARRLAKKGWVAPHWPREYGGLGLSLWEQLIFREEMSYHWAPLGSVAIAVDFVGPTIIIYGTEEQKREHLPRITSAEVVWCQGFSEPNAGSDLANLQTRAVREGDDYVVNGQKIWTSGAHRADWMILLARTDPDAPKHKGISYFLLDMKTPGITIQPIIDIMDNHSFNQVFFENVRVPRRNLLGEENRGWYMATTTLNFERSSIGGAAASRRLLEDLVRYVQETPADGGRLGDDPRVRYRVAESAIEVEVGRLLSYQVVSLQARGEVPSYQASIAKLYNTEMGLRLARTGLDVLGLYGQLRPRSKWVQLRGRFERQFLWMTGMVVGGGTSEIQRNLIAVRGLGLPRG
ncbi:Putative acyl-CoA dehydrogenase FadE17 [bacterium HR25]|jgi:alkylation response protein AidB-like acyl-CoA dehydrogenase|nr:Putative acyl-CoA dehydrogenase FadE17 [bacterium HR25]